MAMIPNEENEKWYEQPFTFQTVKEWLLGKGVKDEDTSVDMPETNPDTTSILQQEWFKELAEPTRNVWDWVKKTVGIQGGEVVQETEKANNVNALALLSIGAGALFIGYKVFK